MASKVARKSEKKSVAKLPDGRVAPGRGPAKGAPNAGRPPKVFKELMAELATGERTVEQLQAILSDKDHPQFTALWKEVTAHAHGKPKAALDLTSKGESLTDIFAAIAANRDGSPRD